MKQSAASASSAAAAAAPRLQGINSVGKEAHVVVETAMDAHAGSETAQELADSMKSLHGFSLDLQRLRAIMDKHRRSHSGR